MRLVGLLIITLLSLSTLAQTHSRVKVWLTSENTILKLASLGIDVTHGIYQPEKFLISEFSETELRQIETAGFLSEVLVADLQDELVRKNAEFSVDSRTQSSCSGSELYPTLSTPRQYTYGSMGGYHTYQELLDVLDTMAARYPKIFRKRQPIDSTLLTHEGRFVYWVKISDNPKKDEDEPEALYTALHHAREPNSLSQLLFFMWYLLENYETDPEVRYLVDNTELYFVPCINPDGYIYNEQTNPAGGGFWRKNRRNNQDGSFGVDVNRNYDFEWGYDELGSSSSSESQTYRGILPESEPETQLMTKFCKDHQFQIALNHHTFGNALLFPWSFADSVTTHQQVFRTWAELMSQDNAYNFGLSTRTLGYTANGTSDDWMYGDTTLKARIFAFTPEIGSAQHGFWPARNQIDGLNKEAFGMNMSVAHLLLNYNELRHSDSPFITSKESKVAVLLRRLGLRGGPVSVNLISKNGKLLSIGDELKFQLEQFDEAGGSIPFELHSTVKNGDSIHLELLVDNGLYTFRFPISKVYSDKAVIAFSDSVTNLNNWTVFGQWGLTAEHFYSASYSITDSPGSPYKPNTLSEITLKEDLKVKSAKAVILSFWARWDIEEDEDYAMVMLSVNGGQFQPLCGKYTENGTYSQVYNQPLYDGIQPFWVKEEIDLTEYLSGDSTSLRFLFRMKADEAVNKDGFYFDDFQLTVLGKDGSTSTLSLFKKDFEVAVTPNPARDWFEISFSALPDKSHKTEVQVFNSLGIQVHSENLTNRQTTKITCIDWPDGQYFYRIRSAGYIIKSGRVFISR